MLNENNLCRLIGMDLDNQLFANYMLFKGFLTPFIKVTSFFEVFCAQL